MRKYRGLMLPVVLTAVGIILLIGCIPIPATRQYQSNGQHRPEHLIGKQPDRPIHFKETKIEDAFIAMSTSLRGGDSMYNWGYFFTSEKRSIENPIDLVQAWAVSSDRRRFSMMYKVRTTTWLVPLCFIALQETEPRWLTLDVNEDGAVTGSTTTAQIPSGVTPAIPDEWVNIFSDTQRAKLRAAGVMPSDEELGAWGRTIRQQRARRNSAAR